VFTVVIAEKAILNSIDKYRLFLAPLLQCNELAFCEWNRKADNLASMVPKLYDLIAKKSDWRAVIIQPDGRYQKNPFDYTGYVENDGISRNTNWDKLLNRRANRFACYEKAISNPLTKLTSAFCGAPVFHTLIEDAALYESIVAGKMSIGEIMLSQQLEQINIAELVRHLKNQGKPKLAQFADEKSQTKLLKLLSEKNTAAIVAMVGLENLIRFIKMIGEDDPRFSDPEYTELILENTKKAALFASLAPAFDFKNIEPEEVICVALRTHDSEEYDSRVKWQSLDEQEYSRFAEFNLYSDKLKYIVFDAEDNDHKQFDYDLIRFLCFVLILSGNTAPAGIMTKNRVYCAECENDIQKLSLLLSAYDEKLKKTTQALREKQSDSLEKDQQKIGSDAFVKKIEAPIVVELNVDSKFDMSTLNVHYRSLGFAKDCPTDEQIFFETQYIGVLKSFQNFLKQPRRSLIRATEDLRQKNAVEDDDALYLSEFQVEDVADSVNDAEQKMVSTVTANIYDTARYTKKMEAVRKEVRKNIDTRMAKKTAVIAGLIAIAGYFLGFIPLFITSANTAGSFSFSGLFTLIACGVFAGVGLGCLLYQRFVLVKKFKKFNAVTGFIVDEVRTVMQKFSEYLSYACKFMRGYSAINRMKESEKKGAVEFKIFEKHIQDIQRTREEFRTLFSEIVLDQNTEFPEVEAYDLDFTIPADYSYELPFENVPTGKIEYLQDGNMVDVPINYVRAVSLRREEIYDV